MATFEYKGINSKGKDVAGVVEADGPADLKARLAKDQVFLTGYKEIVQGGGQGRVAGTSQKGGVLSKEIHFGDFFDRIKLMDIAIMDRQMAVLLRAGVSMGEALQALVDQQERPALKKVLTTVRTRVNEGASLADAMEEHPKVFPPLHINMVRVGEASGTLDLVFERLADFTESQVQLRSKVIAAMIYPALMLTVAVIIVSGMMLLFIPKITAMFEEAGVDLPAITRALIFVTNIFSSTWYIAFPLLIVFYLWFRKWTATEVGRLKYDSFKLKMPIFGRIVQLVAVSRFARTLATLLTSGVQILTALDIVKAIVNNAVLAEALEKTKDAVREGDSIAGPLKQSGLFPAMVVHMIAIGERTGELEQMLGSVAQAYESEVENKISTLTSVLEPVMIVGMGIIVGFMVFALLMPMLKMGEAITM